MADDVCEVHGEPLRDDAVGVFEMGCLLPNPKTAHIAGVLFPHAKTFVWGMGLPDPCPVRYCPACRAAHAAWKASPAGWDVKADRAEALAFVVKFLPVLVELKKYGIGTLAGQGLLPFLSAEQSTVPHRRDEPS